MNRIQNDNQNIDGVDQHPEAGQSLLPLHWSTFYSIMLHSFDAGLCLMIMLDYMWKNLLFQFLLHLCFFFGNSVQKMCTNAPYHITMKTQILGAQI